LHFDAIAGGLQDAYEGVAEHGVANVTNVCGFVRVDAGVLNHLLPWDRRRLACLWARDGRCSKQVQQLCAIEKDVDVTGAGDFDARHLFDALKYRLESLGDRTRRDLLAGRLFDQFRQLERDGKREVAEFGARWRIGSELLHLDAKQLARGDANSFSQLLLQGE